MKYFSKSSLLLLPLLLLLSCIPQKKLEYLQDDITDKTLYDLEHKESVKIKANDELFIKVTSFDDLNYNYFNVQNQYIQTGYSTELSISLISYTVNDSGYINFPVIGKIYLKDYTIDSAREKLQNLLKDYFNQPSVVIKYAFKKVTVLGAVNNPGHFSYSKDRLNIFEALGLASDMSPHGNRREVYLLRTIDDKVQKKVIDLTNDELVFSSNYYINPDDIIYVKSRNSLKWNIISTPITLVLSTLTTSMLIINYLR
ncbi:MAG: polysaccharide biosynthesis/export family protein [Bacteroidales bacterium]|nr:polysaccharide biosynthesis/export family protein [Bacteroidales bacterium]